MTRSLPLLALCAALTPAGCRGPDYGGGADDTAASEGGEETGTPGGSDGGAADGGGATDDRNTGDAYLAGWAIGPDGAPAEGLYVTLCSGGCRYDQTDADGRFSFEDVDSADYAVHVTDVSGELGWADELVLTHIGEGEALDLEIPFTMAALGDATPMTDQAAAEIELVDGLWLTVDPAAIELPFGTDALDLSGASAEIGAFPPLLPVEDALAVWYLDPFDAHAESPMAVRMENRWGLAPGETLALYEASYLDFAWLEAGALTVSSDGSELVGGAVTQFTTLVLAP